jgi:tRNA uridine 5-carboxymethylaminomethyl modification enzyme
LGLVGAERWNTFVTKRERVGVLREALSRERVVPGGTRAVEIQQRCGEIVNKETDLLALLRRPQVRIEMLADLVPLIHEFGEIVASQIEVAMKYEGYIARAHEEIDRLRRHEAVALPPDFDYASISGLSNELKQKLGTARPENLARAARIPGITPAALSILLVHAHAGA